MYKNYNFVPYHNFAHSASVIQLISNFLETSPVTQLCLTEFQQFQTYIIVYVMIRVMQAKTMPSILKRNITYNIIFKDNRWWKIYI